MFTSHFLEKARPLGHKDSALAPKKTTNNHKYAHKPSKTCKKHSIIQEKQLFGSTRSAASPKCLGRKQSENDTTNSCAGVYWSHEWKNNYHSQSALDKTKQSPNNVPTFSRKSSRDAACRDHVVPRALCGVSVQVSFPKGTGARDDQWRGCGAGARRGACAP